MFPLPAKLVRLLASAGLTALMVVSARGVTFAPSRVASGTKAHRSVSSVLFMQSAASTNVQGEITILTPGEIIEREMATGESYSFKVALRAGQYLRVVVEQSGINLIVALSAPNGEKIVE